MVDKKSTVKQIVQSSFFDTGDKETVIPSVLKLSDTARDIMRKRQSNKTSISAFSKSSKPKNTLNDITDKVYSVIKEKMINELESIYTPTVDFDWYNAAKILNDTIKNDDRYTEFSFLIEKKTECDELNLLYYIIEKRNAYQNMLNIIPDDGTATLSDTLIYSMIFKKRIYENSISKIYKDCKIDLNETYTQLEKEQTKGEK
jgi:hypothetical protein